MKKPLSTPPEGHDRTAVVRDPLILNTKPTYVGAIAATVVSDPHHGDTTVQSPGEPRHLQGALAEFDKNACLVLTALETHSDTLVPPAY